MNQTTRTLLVQIDMDSRVPTSRLIKAVARVLNHSRDIDIQGAEVLNYERTGQIQVVDRDKEYEE